MTSTLSGIRVVARRASLLTLVTSAMLLSIAQACAQSSSVDNRSLDPVTPGNSVFGKNGYIEYIAGNLPVVISVPHGGHLRPQGIPDRELGSGGRQDTKTQELAREIIESFRQQTGKFPHVIINRLHRDKLDANREQFDATLDDSIASIAWREFHGFIDSAQRAIEQQWGRSLYIDLHGHRHRRQVVELGYLLISSQLKMSDSQLDSVGGQPMTSLGQFARSISTPSRLIRGDLSLGFQLQKNGIAAVPSPQIPHPGDNPYFSGGYNLERHSAFSGRNALGIQVEVPTEIRNDDVQRRAFASIFARSVLGFLAGARN